ncbi:hypothetical protein Acr_00g0068490 [Actinidia rufa]|uniref:DNAse I-like superfamily protein n=1 Tax=Actinidia rufa TaxID=165716 RepID=A0A7J0DQQ0_9ERIC|nr:hypothetical protein Acr_00g0068490 [Actinidia rufa]
MLDLGLVFLCTELQFLELPLRLFEDFSCLKPLKIRFIPKSKQEIAGLENSDLFVRWLWVAGYWVYANKQLGLFLLGGCSIHTYESGQFLDLFMFENGTPAAIAGSNDLSESDREKPEEVSEAAPTMLEEENLISTLATRQIAPEKTEAGEVAAKQPPKKSYTSLLIGRKQRSEGTALQKVEVGDGPVQILLEDVQVAACRIYVGCGNFNPDTARVIKGARKLTGRLTGMWICHRRPVTVAVAERLDLVLPSPSGHRYRIWSLPSPLLIAVDEIQLPESSSKQSQSIPIQQQTQEGGEIPTEHKIPEPEDQLQNTESSSVHTQRKQQQIPKTQSGGLAAIQNLVARSGGGAGAGRERERGYIEAPNLGASRGASRSRPWRDCLPPPSHHLWPIGAPMRPVEGHRAKRKPFEVKSTLIGVESSLVRSVSKQISHNHSPRRRLTVGSAFPTRSGRVSDELPRKKRRFAVLREIRHHFARFLQLRSRKRHIRKNKVAIMGILETKLSQQSLDGIARKKFRFWRMEDNFQLNPNGRILILRKDDRVNLEIIEKTDQAIHYVASCKSTSTKFAVSFIYAFNTIVGRRPLWENLNNFNTSLELLWLLLGDFNTVLSKEKANGLPVKAYEIRDFRNCCYDLGISDLRSTGAFHTWSNNSVWSKLNRAMVNTRWIQDGLTAQVNFGLPGKHSDHSPCVVNLYGEIDRGASSFKFFNMWVQHESFMDLVSNSWSMRVEGTTTYRLCKKLKTLKDPLKALHRQNFSHISARAEAAEVKLFQAQQKLHDNTGDTTFQSTVPDLRVKAIKLAEAEFSFCFQLAKAKYLKNSDKGIKLFHDLIKSNKIKNQIISLTKVDGAATTSPNQVSSLFVEYYKNLLGRKTECPKMEREVLAEGPLVQEDHNLLLTRPVLDEEIKTALFGIGDDKAPGPDGYTACFFKNPGL